VLASAAPAGHNIVPYLYPLLTLKLVCAAANVVTFSIAQVQQFSVVAT
jgi:hypothetical protein